MPLSFFMWHHQLFLCPSHILVSWQGTPWHPWLRAASTLTPLWRLWFSMTTCSLKCRQKDSTTSPSLTCKLPPSPENHRGCWNHYSNYENLFLFCNDTWRIKCVSIFRYNYMMSLWVGGSGRVRRLAQALNTHIPFCFAALLMATHSLK